jgi:hypothetical protein
MAEAPTGDGELAMPGSLSVLMPLSISGLARQSRSQIEL